MQVHGVLRTLFEFAGLQGALDALLSVQVHGVLRTPFERGGAKGALDSFERAGPRIS